MSVSELSVYVTMKSRLSASGITTGTMGVTVAKTYCDLRGLFKPWETLTPAYKRYTNDVFGSDPFKDNDQQLEHQ